MQFWSFGVPAKGGLRVPSRALADAQSLVWGVAITIAVAGCSDSGGGSGPSEPERTASTSGGTRSSNAKASGSSEAERTPSGGEASGSTDAERTPSGGEASGSTEAERTPSDGGASSTGGTRSANTSKVQAGGAGSSTQSTRATSSSGGARVTHSTTGNTGGQTASSNTSIIGGRSPTGGTTSAIRTVGGAPVGGTSTTSASRAVGGASVGGTSASGGSSAVVTGTDPFVQVWKDDFDSFDASKWELMTHSWEGNLAQFSTDNVSVASGVLSVNLTAATGDAAKPYRGVEMRSKRTLTYGKVSARVRFARGAGVVSGLVTIYTPWPADNWNEIDIEHLGKSPTSTQLNCMVYTGAPVTAPVTQSVSPTQDPLSVNLGFDAEADFHQYDIEWTPASVVFSIDSKLSRTWTKEIARMTLPQNILFTIWASSSADWAGAITSSSVPTSAQIDWIRVYELRK
ncbi:MAG: family 16 glycosylhydrolase [Myxococcales bacterium]